MTQIGWENILVDRQPQTVPRQIVGLSGNMGGEFRMDWTNMSLAPVDAGQELRDCGCGDPGHKPACGFA